MEKLRHSRFLEAVLPILEKLETEWFPADKKTPDGEYYYACTYCDMECGGHERHDEDCWSDLAKRVLIELRAVDVDPKYETSPITDEPRTPEQSLEMRTWNKARIVLKKFYGPNLTAIAPMDYADPDNHNVLCTCRLFANITEASHSDDCQHQAFAKALIAYFTVA